MFVGVDLHKKMAVYTAVDDAGNVIGEGATENTLEGWEKFGQLFPPGTSVALEACVNWGQVCDALEGHGLRPALANSKRVRMIAESKSKTDRIDSQILAQLLRTQFLPQVHIPSAEVRRLRELLSYRWSLGKTSGEIKSRIHGLLVKEWVEVPARVFYGPGKKWLAKVSLPPASRMMLDGLLERLRCVEAEQARCQAVFAQHAREDERVLRLMEIRGIDYYTALIVVSWIDDVRRFPTWRKLAAYVGVVPSSRSSAETAYHGHITKEGPAILRWAVTECIRYVVAENPKLRGALERIGRRRGKGIARVAVARRLVRILYHMLRDGTHYEYRTEKTYRRKLEEMEVEARRYSLPSENASRS